MLEKEVELDCIVPSVQTNNPILIVDNIMSACVLVFIKTEFSRTTECLVELFLVFYEHHWSSGAQ